VNTLRLNCVPVNSGSSIASMSVSLVFVAFSSSSIAMISSSICSSNICGLTLSATYITVASMHTAPPIMLTKMHDAHSCVGNTTSTHKAEAHKL
jgi:hypothetical protein